jgi:hypothetical protein
MRSIGCIFLAAALPLAAQDAAAVANVDEAFRLAGVHAMLESLPAHVNEMTVAAVAQLPKDKRKEFEPLIKEVSLRFLNPDSFYRQLRTYFIKHYDGAKMATFLVLERTPVYRSMHRLEAAAETPAAQAGWRSFDANLKSDPPDPKRVETLQRLDETVKTTDLQVHIVVAILNAISAGLGAQMPADLEAQSAAFRDKIRPILATNTLHHNLYVYRNADNSDLDDYVANAQQPAVAWFQRTLQSAILAVAADRATRAGEDIKAKTAQPPKN